MHGIVHYVTSYVIVVEDIPEEINFHGYVK